MVLSAHLVITQIEFEFHLISPTVLIPLITMVQFSYSSTHYTNWAYANASAGPSAKLHGQALLHSFPLLNLGALSSVTSFQNSSEDTESTKGTSNGSI